MTALADKGNGGDKASEEDKTIFKARRRRRGENERTLRRPVELVVIEAIILQRGLWNEQY